jgi:chromosome partitioning protein
VTVARPGLFVLAGGSNLLQLRSWLAQQTPTTIKEKLQPEPGKIDFLLYDTAPGLDVLAANILSAVDDLIVPVPLQGAALHALTAFVDYYKSAKRYNEKLQLKHLVPTLYDRRTSLHQSILRQLRKAYGDMVADPIPYSVRVAESVSFGKTIFEYDISHMCALRYVALARRICDG